jgi:hypothetical protein
VRRVREVTRARTLWGDAVPPTRREALEAAERRMAAYRRAVGEALVAGAGLDGAHVQARPYMEEARAILRAAGWADAQARDLLGGLFHA